MNALIKTIFACILHNFMTLLVIIGVLFLVPLGWNKWKDSQLFKAELKVVSSVNESYDNVKNEPVENFTKWTKEFDTSIADWTKGKRDAELKKLKERITKLELEKEELLTDQQRNGTLQSLVNKRSLPDVLKDALRREVEIAILTQSLTYLISLEKYLESADEIHSEYERLKGLQQILVTENDKVAQEIFQLKKRYGRLLDVPFTELHDRYQRLLDKQEALPEKFRRVREQLNQKQDRLDRLAPPGKFKVDSKAVEVTLKPLVDRAKDLRRIIDGSWFEKMLKPVEELLPFALKILLGIILTPILIKMLFYFVLAPLAARRPPLQLLPETSGDLTLETGHPAVSRPVVVDGQHELLVHSDFLQSSSDRGCKDTSWFLNKNIWLTSIASGMVALTRIRSDSPETFVISATKNSLSEIGILSIPEGAALVMQPHNLVGIVQLKTSPVHITTHWRLNSLHAWLTLQLRYLAFHGPAQLIVQGCRGVRIEQADGGRSINQAATIGFSANLAYSTRRCETFLAYFLGKRELLNDNFSGDKGFYVYQEMPYADKKSGFPKRSLEGMTESLLKVFGI